MAYDLNADEIFEMTVRIEANGNHRYAVCLEKGSILFYIGLKDMVPPKFGQGKLDKIIAEERRHVVELSALRKKL